MGRDVPVRSPFLSAFLCVFLVLSTTAAAIGASGCAWKGPLPLQTLGAPQVDNVIAIDEAAYKLVALRNHHVSRTVDKRMEVELELLNLSSADLNIQVRTVFRDGEGMLLAEAGVWQMMVLPGSGSSLYKVASLSEKAASAQIEVKTP
jgi:hypothetical protein